VSRERTPLAVDPTVLITPDARPAPPRAKAPVATARGSASGRHTSAKETQPGGFWTPAMRGALFAVGAIAVAGIVVLAVIWLLNRPSATQLQLTLTKPTGGTIVGNGFNCGTDGDECTASFAEGIRVELDPRADKDFAFNGFTGPCAPSGRVVIREALTCGAKFERADLPPPAATFPLTIKKPTGGTILVEPDIICGALQTMCSANVTAGSRIKLTPEAEPGFTFNKFTDDCFPDGETTMSQARTCGATFVQATPPKSPSPPPTSVVRRKTDEAILPIGEPDKGAATVGAQPPSSQTTRLPTQGPQTTTPAQGPANGGPTVTQTPGAAVAGPQTVQGPVAGPISEEEHAKLEIQQLVKQYCEESQTLQPARIKVLFPQADEATMKTRFKEYKSLQCTVTAPPEFDRLDARDAGFAQVKFGMKQVIQMKSGGAPKAIETTVTMVVSRMGRLSPWRIDRLEHVAKPTP